MKENNNKIIMSQAPKFLLGGVNKWSNFFGLRTLQTAVYGWGEVAIKAAPIFAFIYGVRKSQPALSFVLILDHAMTFYTPERDAFLDENKSKDFVTETRRSTLI